VYVSYVICICVVCGIDIDVVSQYMVYAYNCVYYCDTYLCVLLPLYPPPPPPSIAIPPPAPAPVCVCMYVSVCVCVCMLVCVYVC
jgi:hypothetical protein